MPEQNLEQLQRWMQSLLLAPGPLPERLAAQAAHWGFSEADVVAPGGPATVRRRLNVYASGYRMRLLECLSADFPALEQFLGKDLFRRFGEAFLNEHPSRSYTLSELGTPFADFLRRTRPAGSAPQYALPEAIARVERARHEVLRAPGPEEEPQEEWTPARLLLEGATLRHPPCCRLLELPFELKVFYESLLRGEEAALPEPGAAYLALSRVRYRLTIVALGEAEYRLLRACAEPQPFYPLLQRAGLTAAEALPWLERFQQIGLIVLS